MTRYCLNKIPILLAVVWLTPVAMAGAINKNEMTSAAETWVRYVTADARESAKVESIESYEVDGATVAYIVHLDTGYCICGADDQLLPVYLYNASGTYDSTNPNYQAILDEIATRYFKILDAESKNDPVLEQYSDELAIRTEQWDALIAGEIPVVPEEKGTRSTPVSMTLPVKNHWHQGTPFNDYCPELTPGADEHTIVGCVATAMAQIMYYWKWPSSGVGTASGTYNFRYSTVWLIEPLATDPGISTSPTWTNRLHWYSSNGGELWMKGYWDSSLYEVAQNISEDGDFQDALSDLWGRLTSDSTSYSANPGAATYNWNIMPETCTDPPSAGTLEAAEVSYHNGVVLGMVYGLKASSAFTSSTPFVYVSRYDYDPDCAFTSRSTTTMMNEIQWYRPVQLKGQSDSGGHSWVVAGYNTGVSPTQFLMNMGWGGGTTDWYTIDVMFPSDQGHAIRIAPESVVRFVDYGIFGSGDGTPDNPYLGLAHATTLAPENTTLIIKAGTTHPLSGSPAVLDKPMTYKGYDVWIEKD